ncbi:methyl-accepting chemotaxis protein [Cohnella luojiensis]|uniref:Methyl-accepting chemotaxis protein n=1 Tax=Cohnella luojiensis TaxID=652876 RepID=A0A4Y8LWM8_9BACL|nr:methyl-accepting chemotaxis protein [Cohnella luojiensis]TFE25419.1 methyl-accepting chemotaxis protein [Cohnella luojiensis]
MKWFLNRKLSTKLIALLSIPILALAITAVSSTQKLDKVSESLIEALYSEAYSNSGGMLNADRDMYQAYVGFRLLLTTDAQDEQFQGYQDEYDENIVQVKDRILKVKENFNAHIEEYADLVHPESRRTAFENFDIFTKEFDQWVSASTAIIDSIQAVPVGQRNDFMERANAADGNFQTARDQLDQVQAIIDIDAENEIKAERKQADRLKIDVVSMVGGALILVILIGWILIRDITVSVKRVAVLANQVADGDLKVEPLEIKSKDEIGQLTQSVNTMVDNLRALITSVLASIQNVSASAQQISASTEEIASGSSSQSHAAQTMNELIREFTDSIDAVAKNAEYAAQLSGQTKQGAEEGGHTVSSSIQGMNHLSRQMSLLQDDSNKIGDIIEVIDDIAEQTNLLALNAAIEAARAGEQGRGFAVVADEVRKLAERSGEATKQIASIIKGMQHNTQQSVKAVTDAVSLSEKTETAFGDIIRKVNEAAKQVTEIAAASEQQAAQSGEVMNAIESIAAASEESTAAAEETASSAQSLAELAEELNASVSKFKI